MTEQHVGSAPPEISPIDIVQMRLEFMAKDASLLIERGNCLHDILTRVELEGEVGLRTVSLKSGDELDDIGFQFVRHEGQDDDRTSSEIYSRDIILDTLKLLVIDPEKQKMIESKLESMEQGAYFKLQFIVQK